MDWYRTFSRKLVEGEPFSIEKRRIFPQANITSLSIGALGNHLGFEFAQTQPVAIVVEDQQGTRTIQIHDITGLIVTILTASSILLFVIAQLMTRSNSRHN